MRLLSCSVVVLAGALCFAGAIVPATNAGIHTNERNIGCLIMIIGGVLFLIEYLRSWNVDR